MILRKERRGVFSLGQYLTLDKSFHETKCRGDYETIGPNL